MRLGQTNKFDLSLDFHYLCSVVAMKMKKTVLFLAFVLVASGVDAQKIGRMRESLARPAAFSRARVEVTEQPDAARAVATADNAAGRTKITVYRVSLLSDNSQNAGSNAQAVAARFGELFPGIAVDVSYESPHFKVAAGNFIDRVDAVALCGKVLSHFPKAYVKQEEVPVSNVVSSTVLRQNSSSSAPAEENNGKTIDN